VHDYLQIIGVPKDATYREIRRAAARGARRSHPDFATRGTADRLDLTSHDRHQRADAAVDFVVMTAIVDRMHAAFFGSRR
jgi:DnaJ-class molecular chaperone